jgi:hypothetical protein
VRISECAAVVLITQVPRSARDASHAATRLQRIFLCSVQNSSFGRVLPSSLSTIPMVHYSSTFQEAQIGLSIS